MKWLWSVTHFDRLTATAFWSPRMLSKRTTVLGDVASGDSCLLSLLTFHHIIWKQNKQITSYAPKSREIQHVLKKWTLREKSLSTKRDLISISWALSSQSYMKFESAVIINGIFHPLKVISPGNINSIWMTSKVSSLTNNNNQSSFSCSVWRPASGCWILAVNLWWQVFPKVFQGQVGY